MEVMAVLVAVQDIRDEAGDIFQSLERKKSDRLGWILGSDSPHLFVFGCCHQVLVGGQGLNLTELPHQVAALLVF